MSGSFGGSNAVERRCESNDCNVLKLLSIVPKKKTTQFIIEPTIQENPLIIKGFTTIFQVDGSKAKLDDLKKATTEPGAAKPIYRIVPDTHAHIVNYVVVDADGETMRKINENDPATMKKLLDSQKSSANQMLKKLIAGHVPNLRSQEQTAVLSTSTSTATSASAEAANIINHHTNLNNMITTSSMNPNLSAIQMPVRMHPNLKITAVASVNEKSPIIPTGISQVPIASQGPLITPVPIANLQNPTTHVITNPLLAGKIPPPYATATMMPTTMIPTTQQVLTQSVEPSFDKMQAELRELRRTVAIIAENQAKTGKSKAKTSTTQPGKRQRIN